MTESEKVLDKAFGKLASLIHKDYQAGPDGFKIFKEDVYKYMAKAAEYALEPEKPLPKDTPKF